MANVSVKDTWFSDPRRNRLIKLLNCDPRLVDGIMLECWRIGQEFEVKGDLPSFRIFNSSELQAIISAGLAERSGDGVYFFGSKEAAVYRLKSKISGSVGGKKSAEMRRSKINNLTVAKASESNLPLLLPLLPQELNTYTPTVVGDFGFDSFWEEYPKKEGKTLAQKSYAKQIKNAESHKTLMFALKNYKAKIKRNSTKKEFVKQGSTFMRDWRDFLEPELEETKPASGPEFWPGVSDVE